MATATLKPTSQPGHDPAKLTVGEELIAATIAQAQAALWRAELSRRLLKWAIAVMAGALAWIAIDQWIWSPGWPIRLSALVVAVGGSVWWFVTQVFPLMHSRVRADYAAQSLESDIPELRHQLSSYVTLRGDLDTQGVRGAVVRSIGARAAGHLKQHRIEVPSEATGTLAWWVAMAITLGVVAAYALLSPKNTLQSAQRLLLPLASIDAPSRVAISDVSPGDTEVLADRPVEISAAIRGLLSKETASVVYGVGYAQHTAMAYDASTNRYLAKVAVPASTQYKLIAGDAVAGPYQLRTRDVPVASVRQVEITPPGYTGLPKRISTGGAIIGEESSRVTITAEVNRPIVRGRIEFNPREGTTDNGPAVRIGPSSGGMDMQIAGDGMSATSEIVLRLPREKSAAVPLAAYRVRVWDADGNENPEPIVYPVRIIGDLPPEVNIVQPRELTKELPINAQQMVEIAAVDPDYGLRRIELVWQRGADQPKTEILWSADKGERGNRVADYRFRPEKLGLRVGDRIKVTAVASDNREDESGNYDPNRTTSQPVEWVIVQPRQLPPPTAPEDGVSESDGEPATGSDQDPQSQQGESGGKSGDGQAAGQQGASAGSDGKDDAQQGKGSGSGSEPSDGSGEESGKESGGQAGGKKGDGASKPDMSNRDDASGESDGESPGKSDGKQPSGEQPGSDQNGGEQPGGEGAKGSQAGRDMGQTQDGQKPADGQQAADGQQPADGQQTGPQSGDLGNQPPEHDGDAFEKIRDYLNKKRNQNGGGQQPPQDGGQTPDRNNQPGSDPKNDPTSGDQQKGDPSQGDQQASDQRNGDRPNPTEGKSGGGESDSGLDQTQQERSGESTDGMNREPAKGPSDPAAPKPSETGQQSEPGQQPGETQQENGKPGEAGKTESGQKQDGGQPGPQAPQPGQSKPSGKPSSDGAMPRDSANGEGAQGDARPADSPQGDSTKAGDKPGENPKGGEQAGDGKPGDSGLGDAGRQGQDGHEGQDGRPDPARSGDDRRAPNSNLPSNGGGVGDGNTAGSGSGDGAGAPPADQADVDYARQATDLVLDYLDQNRETPDPELLERLNWTPEELREFTDRWKQVLKSQSDGGAGNAGDAKQVEETLRSLGIRPPADGPIGQSRDQADAIRNLRDSGNRPAAPSIYRDAFEAFRRGVNR